MRKLALGLGVAIAVTLVLGAAANGFRSSVSRAPKGTGAAAALGPGPIVIQGAGLPVTVDALLVDTENGATAVVVTIQNTAAAMVDVPVSIEFLDASGAVVGTSAAQGTDPQLNHIPGLPKGASQYVNDGIAFTGTPTSARVKVGAGAAGVLRVLQVKDAKVDSSIYGPVVRGTLVNPGQQPAADVLVEAVVRSGGTIVAAGTARVEAVKAGGKATFDIPLVGDPKGGTPTAWAPGAP